MEKSSGITSEIKTSRSMSLLPPSNIDTKIIKQIGNYTLGMELGRGAFGKVVLGKHIITGETVAVKILDKIILSQTPEDYELVKKEMSILKLVKHKYIIQLYEILQTPNHIFIIMEYCEGKDIMDYILSKNFLPESLALKYFQQLINALFYLHSQNIAHRDIKIDNILLDRNKNLKLIDFGLSTKYSDDKLLDQPCGTIVYSAPEVLDGQPYHGMLADVWSSGIVLYGMLSGYLPFSDSDDNINKKLIIQGKIEMPDYISPWVKDLLKHMLDINPMTRYTLQDIKEHPWFNMNDFILIQGIIIGYHKIPVDERILDLCEQFNFDKNKVRNSVINNKFDSGSALYYLLVKQGNKKGISSVSDLNSREFINFIYNDNNLLENSIKNSEKEKEKYKKTAENIHNENECKNKEDQRKPEKLVNNKVDDKNKKQEFNLTVSSEPINLVTTPKKNGRKRIISNFNKNYNVYDDKNKKRNSNSNISKFKKNKKIKLFSSINKKSISKIQKTTNFISTFIEDNKNNDNFNLNTSKIYSKNKTKTKIKKNVIINKNINQNIILNKNKNYLNGININNNRFYKTKYEKEEHSVISTEKFIFNNKKQNPIKINRKESTNIGNSFLDSSIQNDSNQQLSLKDYVIKRNVDDNYSSTTNSHIFQKKKCSKEKIDNKYFSKNKSQKIQKSYKKIIKQDATEINLDNKNSIKDKSSIETINKQMLSKNSKSNTKIIFHRNKDLSNKFKISKSIESNDNKTEILNFINLNYNNNRKSKEKYNNRSNKSINKSNGSKDQINLKKSFKGKITLNSKNSNNVKKNVTPMNKMKGNNYLSNKISSTNSQDKKKFKTNIKLQTRNDRNNGGFTNYTKACSHSTNNINNTSKVKINLNSNKNIFINNNNNENYNKKIYNLKQQITTNGQTEISSNIIIDNEIRNKSPIIKENNNRTLKTFYNNNIRLIKNFKNDNIKRTSNYFGINNNILKEIKDKLHQNIKQSQILYDKNKSNSNIFNSVVSIKKHKNIINLNNNNASKKNLSILLVNQKSIISNENLTSPTYSKIKSKIQHNKDFSYERKKSKKMNKKKSTNKRHFESSVITYRYQSPIVTRGLSESPKQKYLNEKTRYAQIPWKIKKKGIDEKLSEEIIYNRYIHKMKKNPFILNNNKIKKTKYKNMKIHTSSNNNFYKQKSNSLNKSKKKAKIKFNNNINHMNTCYSKDNLHNVVPNLKYKMNSPSNQNKKNKVKEMNNQSLNFLEIRTFPLLKAINKKSTHNSNKRIYHRNVNHFNISNTNNTNTNSTNNNNFYNFSVSTSLSMNSIAILKGRPKFNNVELSIIDLACIEIGKKSLNDCCINLINKLKSNGISYVQKKNNLFNCNKNGEFCEIEIVQLFLENGDFSGNNEKVNINDTEKGLPIFYYKIFNKKGRFNVNKIFSKIILYP